MELLLGIHLLERVRGANVFLLDDPESPTLIDVGLPRNGPRIARSLGEAGRAPTELKQVLLTHFHIDHSGGAAEVRDLTGARILCQAADAELLGLWPSRNSRPWRRLSPQGTPVDGLLTDGQVLPILGGLQVIHTPGHTPGSLSFYLPEQRAVFVGDLFLHTDGWLNRPSPGATSDQEQYERSLQRIGELNAEVCLPAHGPALLSGAAEAIWALVENR